MLSLSVAAQGNCPNLNLNNFESFDWNFLSSEVVSPGVMCEMTRVAGGIGVYTPRVWHGPTRVALPEGSPRIAITGCSGMIGANIVTYMRKIVPFARFHCLERNIDEKRERFVAAWRADNATRSTISLHELDLTRVEDIPAAMARVGEIDVLILTSAAMVRGGAESYDSGVAMAKINTIAPYAVVRHARLAPRARVIGLTSRAGEATHDACDAPAVLNPADATPPKAFGTWTWYVCTKRFFGMLMADLAQELEGTDRSVVWLHPGNVGYKADMKLATTGLVPQDGFADFKGRAPTLLDLLSFSLLEGSDSPATASYTVVMHAFADEAVNNRYNAMQNRLHPPTRFSGQVVYPYEFRYGTGYHARTVQVIKDAMARLLARPGRAARSATASYPYEVVRDVDDGVVPAVHNRLRASATSFFETLRGNFLANNDSVTCPYLFNKQTSDPFAAIPDVVRNVIGI